MHSRNIKVSIVPFFCQRLGNQPRGGKKKRGVRKINDIPSRKKSFLIRDPDVDAVVVVVSVGVGVDSSLDRLGTNEEQKLN